MMHRSPSEEDLLRIEALLLVGKHQEASHLCLHQLEAIHKKVHELHKQRQHTKEKGDVEALAAYNQEKKLLRERYTV